MSERQSRSSDGLKKIRDVDVDPRTAGLALQAGEATTGVNVTLGESKNGKVKVIIDLGSGSEAERVLTNAAFFANLQRIGYKDRRKSNPQAPKTS